MSMNMHKTVRNALRPLLVGMLLALLGCQSNPSREVSAIQKEVDESLAAAQQATPSTPPPEISDALLPPLHVELHLRCNP